MSSEKAKQGSRRRSLTRQRINYFSFKCAHLRQTAKDRGLEFDLTPAYLESIWPADGICQALGVPMIRPQDVDEVRPNHPHSASVDRIDNNIGYVPGNCVWITLAANRAKGNLTIDQLESIARFFRGVAR